MHDDGPQPALGEAPGASRRPAGALEAEVLAVLRLLVVFEPENVNVCTSPIVLKNGSTVSRTKRRSCEIVACTVRAVPSESTVITG